jgi:hypothetical protein
MTTTAKGTPCSVMPDEPGLKFYPKLRRIRRALPGAPPLFGSLMMFGKCSALIGRAERHDR